MDKPNEIYLKRDENHDKDLLNIVMMLLNRGYDILLRDEEGATVIEYDSAYWKGLGNPTFEYINNIISDLAQDTASYRDLENAEYYDDSTADQVLLEVDDALVEDDGISDSDVDNLF